MLRMLFLVRLDATPILWHQVHPLYRNAASTDELGALFLSHARPHMSAV